MKKNLIYILLRDSFCTARILDYRSSGTFKQSFWCFCQIKCVILLILLTLFLNIPELKGADEASFEPCRGSSYSPLDDWTYFQLSILPGVPVDSFYFDVYGIKLGIPFTCGQGHVMGFEPSIIYSGTDFIDGVQASCIYSATKNLKGMQIAGLYASAGEINGIQLSPVNIAKKRTDGIQLGGINYSVNNGGVIQFGLINIIKDGWLPFSVIINFNFNNQTGGKNKSSRNMSYEKK